MAGSKRVHAYQQEHSEALTSPNTAAPSDFVLPLHSADLGRLPLRLFAGAARDVHQNSWYVPPQTGAHDQAQSLPVLPSENDTVPDMLTEGFGVHDPAAISASNVLNLAPDVATPQAPHMFVPMAPPAGVHDGSIENMMAAVSMEPPMMPDLSEDDTLAMWYNAPPGFE